MVFTTKRERENWLVSPGGGRWKPGIKEPGMSYIIHGHENFELISTIMSAYKAHTHTRPVIAIH